MTTAGQARTTQRTAAIRVEDKASSPEALEAAMRLTEGDLPRDVPPGPP
jgi:hypothetical protein